jgi:hypothetical protein
MADGRGKRIARACPLVRIIVFRGDADNIVHPSNANLMVEAADESAESAETRHAAVRPHTRTVTRDKTGAVVIEQWLVHGSGYAWSGGKSARALIRIRMAQTRREKCSDSP